jgi:hypothetical protein
MLPDVSPPVVEAPAAVSVASCLGHSLTNVGTATASDDCAEVEATGEVIATNGQTLSTPIPVVGGYVLLGVGTHTIRWEASDGTNDSQVLQTVVVKPAIQARESFQRAVRRGYQVTGLHRDLTTNRAFFTLVASSPADTNPGRS